MISPFRYGLPGRQDGSDEALRSWNARCVAEMLARQDQAGDS